MNVTMSMNNVLNIVHAMALTTNNKKWLGERLIEEAKAETKQKAQLHKGDSATLTNLNLKGWTPVFPQETHITKNGSTLTLHVEQNHSVVFIR